MYITYQNFAAIPKPEAYRAIFIMRDPRDILISWYFSTAYSHPIVSKEDKMAQNRRSLQESTLEEGLLYGIEFLNERGLFVALESWINTDTHDPNVLLVRYEDIVGTDFERFFRRIFEHCNVALPDKAFKALLNDYSFKQMTGRGQGVEDKSSKFRKGIAGDWKNHFTDKVETQFEKITGNLVTQLGYNQ